MGTRFLISVNRFPEVGPRLLQKLKDVNFTAATNIVERAAVSMEGPKSGHQYRVPGTRRAVHRASSPGEAPAILTGQLHGSMYVREAGGNAFMAATDDEKAPWLEWGTHSVAPRPFLLPATEAERYDWEQAVIAAIDETVG